MMTTTTTTTTAAAAARGNTISTTDAALSTASTPAGSARASPAASTIAKAIVVVAPPAASAAAVAKALAPKKLIVRAPLRASFKIKSRTVFPSTEGACKPWKAQVIRAKEDAPFEKRGTSAEEDAEIAANLPANPYRKQDAYGNPHYRAWAPCAQGGCPLEDHMMVLVHFAPIGLETQEDKPADTYMHFAAFKRHSLDKRIKEWPIATRFGADLMFFEDEQLRANRIAVEAAGGKPIQKKGSFACVWRFTHADHAGYDKFIEGISANLKKRSWTEADL
jgi:hypothetical protein